MFFPYVIPDLLVFETSFFTTEGQNPGGAWILPCNRIKIGGILGGTVGMRDPLSADRQGFEGIF